MNVKSKIFIIKCLTITTVLFLYGSISFASDISAGNSKVYYSKKINREAKSLPFPSVISEKYLYIYSYALVDSDKIYFVGDFNNVIHKYRTDREVHLAFYDYKTGAIEIIDIISEEDSTRYLRNNRTPVFAVIFNDNLSSEHTILYAFTASYEGRTSVEATSSFKIYQSNNKKYSLMLKEVYANEYVTSNAYYYDSSEQVELGFDDKFFEQPRYIINDVNKDGFEDIVIWIKKYEFKSAITDYEVLFATKENNMMVMLFDNENKVFKKPEKLDENALLDLGPLTDRIIAVTKPVVKGVE